MLGGIKQVQVHGKVNCFEMGHRLDLVPAIASAGFREGFSPGFLGLRILWRRRGSSSNVIRRAVV